MRPLVLHNVLVASDLSAADIPALRAASELAALTESSLHVVHAVPDGSDEHALARHIADAQLSAPVSDARTVQGLPGATIIQEAWRTDADVIVLGPHRPDRPGALGNTANRVVRAVASPCLILRRGLALPLRHVLVAVDIAEGARGILAVAMTWASALRRRAASPTEGTTVVALHVIQRSSANADSLRALEHEVELVRQHLSDVAGVDVQHTVENADDPAAAILRQAEADSFDLVVLGTRSGRYQNGTPLGSVSSAVVKRATVPLLLVPSALWSSTQHDPLP